MYCKFSSQRLYLYVYNGNGCYANKLLLCILIFMNNVFQKKQKILLNFNLAFVVFSFCYKVTDFIVSMRFCAQADLNLCCVHMLEGKFSHIVAHV